MRALFVDIDDTPTVLELPSPSVSVIAAHLGGPPVHWDLLARRTASGELIAAVYGGTGHFLTEVAGPCAERPVMFTSINGLSADDVLQLCADLVLQGAMA